MELMELSNETKRELLASCTEDELRTGLEVAQVLGRTDISYNNWYILRMIGLYNVNISGGQDNMCGDSKSFELLPEELDVFILKLQKIQKKNNTNV